ncbi:hypothetical protein ACFY05_32595 [Microtetraspora fusca]|uniref:Uncharacterized protein n=1 Tax=Microtetraspora fusca TaxID=1997 RepID=A0ABW6VH86_MICFU
MNQLGASHAEDLLGVVLPVEEADAFGRACSVEGVDPAEGVRRAIAVWTYMSRLRRDRRGGLQVATPPQT